MLLLLRMGRVGSVCLLGLALVGSLAAAPTPDQHKEIGELGTLLTKAGNLYNESKFQEAGEIIKDMDGTFTRLRRQMARLTDAQLAEDDWYAAFVIGGNTYGHYEEHWADIHARDARSGARPRR